MEENGKKKKGNRYDDYDTHTQILLISIFIILRRNFGGIGEKKDTLLYKLGFSVA